MCYRFVYWYVSGHFKNIRNFPLVNEKFPKFDKMREDISGPNFLKKFHSGLLGNTQNDRVDLSKISNGSSSPEGMSLSNSPAMDENSY